MEATELDLGGAAGCSRKSSRPLLDPRPPGPLASWTVLDPRPTSAGTLLGPSRPRASWPPAPAAVGQQQWLRQCR
ncbi:hypothetical protein NDU88_001233 [Pleurodeles waltl]|uniref:Uncharacterized protein n=1 Tax=Pleurodeles waltl TaxID=8319 RepID=A0AAV7MJX3_PLEWA|nr:hypothetical protein NDU88_001233 [Pleurodeles waltl]